MSEEQNKEEKKENSYNDIEVTAGGIIYNEEGEILFIRSPKFKNTFVVPGGHVNKNESFVNAFQREIKEETGLEVENIEPLDFEEAINPGYFHRPVHFIHLHFIAKAKKGEVKLNDEATEFVWIKPEEALKREDVGCHNTIRNYLRLKECSPAKLTEYLNNWKRALADYDNLKKETAKEREEMGKFAMGMAAMSFLGVYENFKKALNYDTNDANGDANVANYANVEKWENWKKGIGHVKNQFAEVLKQMGIEEIKTVGEKFDPKWHEAVDEESVEGKEPGVIVREAEGGYKMGEKVVKAAKVVVNK